MENNNAARTIPEDLIIEIFLRLSVKSLLKLKSVCKKWNKLIKSPDFVRRYHNHNLQFVDTASGLLVSRWDLEKEVEVFCFRSNDESVNELPLSDFQLPTDAGRYVSVIGSYNGIVCFRDNYSTIFLCNPATRELKQLPPTSFKSQNGTTFRKEKSPSFGFDSSDIYNLKVISLSTYIDGNKKMGLKGEVYTMKSNAWRQLHWGGGKDMILCTNDGVNRFYGNSCHWHVAYQNCPGSGIKQSILRFDMHKEKFRIIGFPQDYKPKGYSIVLVHNGYLAVCDSSYRRSSVEQIIEIWIMKDYGVEGSWTKLCTSAPATLHLYPLTFSLEDALLLRCYNEKLISLNPHTGTFDYLKSRGPYDSIVITYRETLLSFK